MTSRSELSTTSASTLYELATRVHGELRGPSARAITDALAEAGFPVTGLADRLGAALQRYAELRAEQLEDVGDARDATEALTALRKEISRTIRALDRRADLYVSGAELVDGEGTTLDPERVAAFGRRLKAATSRAYVGPDGGSVKDLFYVLNDLRRVLGRAPEGLPGLPPRIRNEVAGQWVRLHGGVYAEEDAQTAQEHASLRARTARRRLEGLLLGYLKMREVVDADRAEAGEPGLPNENLALLRQWAATRPSDVAARQAAAQPLDHLDDDETVDA